MAIIKCPECGMNISDKAENCVHCGYPLNLATQNEAESTAMYKVILTKISNRAKDKVLLSKMIKEITGCNVKEAHDLVANNPSGIIISDIDYDHAIYIARILSINGTVAEAVPSTYQKVYNEFDEKLKRLEKVSEMHDYSNQHHAQCPTCGSHNVKKISLANKSIHYNVFGILGMGKVMKTFQCKNCGYEW